jgi:hypothetical protein
VDISKRLIILFFLLISSTSFCQNINSFKQVTIQGFRCDSHNDNYFYIYSDYLVDQALRLRSLGIDTLWITLFIKNKNYYILNINGKIFLGGLEKGIYLLRYS